MRSSKGIEKIVKNSKHVSIDYNKLEELAREISSYGPIDWIEQCPVDLSDLTDEQTIAFLFTFNAISFSYWGTPKWTTGYERGTWSMIHALKKAIDNGKPILDPHYLANINQQDLEDILQGNVRIPLFNERLMILKELGQSIKSYHKFIEATNHDALEFVDRLTLYVPSFRDYSKYEGELVVFNKRAQLLASDLGHLLGFRNLDRLTICADYIIPMVYRYKGVLIYSPELEAKINSRKELFIDSEEVIEIRANTIWIGKLTDLPPKQVNDYSWLKGDSVPEGYEHPRFRDTAC